MIQLLEDLCCVSLHGMLGPAALKGDLLVEKSIGNEIKYSQLDDGEPGDPGGELIHVVIKSC